MGNGHRVLISGDGLKDMSTFPAQLAYPGFQSATSNERPTCYVHWPLAKSKVRLYAPFQLFDPFRMRKLGLGAIFRRRAVRINSIWNIVAIVV